MPIRFIVASRRVNYLHTILSREKSELTQRVYQAQKSKPSKGDWVNIVRKDCDDLLIIFDETLITSMSKNKFKSFVKKQVQNAAFSYLRNLQNAHSKVKNIEYEKLAPQEYIKSTLFQNEDIETIFSLRSQMITVKGNFSGMYTEENLKCSFGCQTKETQPHLLLKLSP